MSNDIVAFISARLDEQEREFSQGHEPGECHPNCGHVCDLRGVEAKRRIVELHRHEGTRWEAIAAVTGIPADDIPDRGCLVCSARDEDGGVTLDLGKSWCMTLRYLASEFSDHPDYRQEWTP